MSPAPKAADPFRAGVALNLYLGQRVRIDSKHCAGKTGRIQALEIARGDEPGCILATVDLDDPIISPACVVEGKHFRAIETWTQRVPAVELTVFTHENEVRHD